MRYLKVVARKRANPAGAGGRGYFLPRLRRDKKFRDDSTEGLKINLQTAADLRYNSQFPFFPPTPTPPPFTFSLFPSNPFSVRNTHGQLPAIRQARAAVRQAPTARAGAPLAIPHRRQKNARRRRLRRQPRRRRRLPRLSNRRRPPRRPWNRPRQRRRPTQKPTQRRRQKSAQSGSAKTEAVPAKAESVPAKTESVPAKAKSGSTESVPTKSESVPPESESESPPTESESSPPESRPSGDGAEKAA